MTELKGSLACETGFSECFKNKHGDLSSLNLKEGDAFLRGTVKYRLILSIGHGVRSQGLFKGDNEFSWCKGISAATRRGT